MRHTCTLISILKYFLEALVVSIHPCPSRSYKCRAFGSSPTLSSHSYLCHRIISMSFSSKNSSAPMGALRSTMWLKHTLLNEYLLRTVMVRGGTPAEWIMRKSWLLFHSYSK
ncbi:hypothetical protein BOTBODRAFT_64106 [Botryobasidium botryosum FD-172 SS1]|uniref:Secreted protein n=1 Tax=Botryobasidium botryosum (strain FD-172 SS1) TaxID=930990 RepID=A0A067MPJ2_BOTB1|nr:hypothetical protein BOTBODRAFT_64106 [Botryobasidium botryosum FD-172 SS1]